MEAHTLAVSVLPHLLTIVWQKRIEKKWWRRCLYKFVEFQVVWTIYFSRRSLYDFKMTYCLAKKYIVLLRFECQMF